MSQQSKHTPGPWDIRHSGHIVGKADHFPTELVCKYNISGNEDLDGANARLIAAAPELLEALEKLLGQINISGVNVWTVTGVMDAERAIAKARGQS